MLALLAMAALPAGCGPADDVALVNELAARLDSAGDLTYTAEYRLGDQTAATIAQAQDPKRAAYTFPGGKAVVTDTSAADCRAAGGEVRCVLSVPPSPNTDPALDLLTRTDDGGLVSPVTVVRRLTAAIDEGATITRHDATIAGAPARCVGVHGSAGFTACLTGDGLLGSFTGTVDGSPVDIHLTRLTPAADNVQFDLPPGARVDDRRPAAD